MSKLEVVKQRVFEYVVIKHPTVEEAESGAGSEIIAGPAVVCATDEKGAAMRANRAVPEEEMKNESRLEVVIRGF